ncbi:MAG: endonuclease/exonuclease/phosphatase family protein [Rhizobiaceae bacterium]
MVNLQAVELDWLLLYRMACDEAKEADATFTWRSTPMTMKCVTYNIQFGFGMDSRYDLERIVDAVRGADLIALQEVTRNNPQNGGVDMVDGLCNLLPDYFHVFGAPFQLGFASRMEGEKAVSEYFEFGNMILSKKPIISSRNLLLPRTRTEEVLNLQRGALEAMVETPIGPVRFYSVHLDHMREAERLAQIDFLMQRVLSYTEEGGAVSGLPSRGFPEPPHPEHAILMGDFNMEPESSGYVAICGPAANRVGEFIDISIPEGIAAADSHTWFDTGDTGRKSRLDYCFVTPGLAGHAGKARVDTEAQGSDHRPVWFELG